MPTLNVDNQPLSKAVIKAVAAEQGLRPFPSRGLRKGDNWDGIESLSETIDPEALDALFETCEDGNDSSVIVEFVYSGYNVIIEDRDKITITELEREN